MDYIRGLIQGYTTRKYRDDGFNLDLTYTTDRVIAMAFPGSGLQTIIRNNIDHVVKFLTHKHHQNYLIIDLSEQRYEYTKFNSQVKSFAWEDNHSPSLGLIFSVCECIHNRLSADARNIVAVHCLAGRGRTGTMIGCYLMYSGRFDNCEQILEYYKKKRFKSGEGVVECSQIRYIQYFERVLKSYIKTKTVFEPVVGRLESIKIDHVPKFSSQGFRPRIEIYSVDDRRMLFISEETTTKVSSMDNKDENCIIITFSAGSAPILTGDIQLRVFHENKSGGQIQKAFRFAFNTSFLDVDETMTAKIKLGLQQLDPEKVKYDKRFSKDFSVEMKINVVDMLNRSSNLSISDEQFETCQAECHGEQKRWNLIYEMLNKYQRPTPEESVKFLFTDLERDDVENILARKESLT